jgi:phage baseplate assembly protein gpV
MNGLERFAHDYGDADRDHRNLSVVTAKVTKIQDDGLYELQYLASVDPAVHGDARVMAPMAGAGRGAFMLPEVNDEVVVAFEDGDPNQPIILGGVWNRESQPPSQARQSPDNDIRTIVSRSGHELTFDDSPGSQRVILKSRGGPEVVLDGQTATVHSGAATITVGPGGAIKIEGARITLAAGTIAIEGALTINGMPYAMHIHSPAVVPTPAGPVTGPVGGI